MTGETPKVYESDEVVVLREELRMVYALVDRLQHRLGVSPIQKESARIKRENLRGNIKQLHAVCTHQRDIIHGLLERLHKHEPNDVHVRWWQDALANRKSRKAARKLRALVKAKGETVA